MVAFAACKKGNTYYEDYQLPDAEFDGTTLKFLESQGAVYDSLLLALDRVPDLRAKLNSMSDTLTFFASSNSSFTNAIEAMNSVRKAGNRTPLYLEDIPQLMLDSLMYHYTFRGNHNTESLDQLVEGKEIRSIDDYRMHMMYNVTSASGVTGGGQQQIKLSDMNNSIFQRYWQESNTSVVNIKTKNGTLHVLTPSHNFGFSKLAKLLNK